MQIDMVAVIFGAISLSFPAFAWGYAIGYRRSLSERGLS